MVEPCHETHTLTVKYLCSYGGKIMPRHPDRKLRYHGGQTRLLTCSRSISFSELMVKLGELCGRRVSLRCQLPAEDLDALVSITSDEDLANLLEEYDRVSSTSLPLKIKAFLSPLKATASERFSQKPSNIYSPRHMLNSRCAMYPLMSYEKSIGSLKVPQYITYGATSRAYLHRL